MQKIKKELSSEKTSIFEKLVPALLVITIGLSFLVGILWQKVENLGKSGSANTAGVQQQAQQPRKVDLSQIKDLFNKDVVKMGSADSKLTFVEISDPSCPYCHVAGGLNPSLNNQIGPQFKLTTEGGSYVAPVPEMRKMVEDGKASFVWIYYPGHGNGEMGAKALFCANEKGKFWAVNDLLMTSKGYDLLNGVVKNDKSMSGKLADFLKSAKVDGLKECLDSGKYDKQLTTDISLAQELGVSGTPGFYVNETNFAGAYSFKDMEGAVASALK
jgi:protein-disulfide isomerase